MKPIFIDTKIINKSNNSLNANQFQIIRNSNFLKYKTIQELVIYYEQSDPDKIALSLFLQKILKEYNILSMLSLGCGEAVVEYFIKKEYPLINIAISDFDESIINHNRDIYGILFSDYLNHDISKKQIKIPKNEFNLILLNAVIYVLNNNEAKSLFNNFYTNDIEYVLIVHTAELSIINEIKKALFSILKYKNNPKNTFWGWARYKREIVSIALSQGYRLINYSSPTFGSYRRGIYLFQKH